MFNTVLPYRFVQRNRNRSAGRESWLLEDIYKFFVHSHDSRRKYLVEVHAYPGHLYTVDFYAKVHDVNRYRLQTNQQAAGKLGSTVLAIMAGILRQDPAACFGFIAAALLTETSDANTKRFRLYTRMLEQKINPRRHGVVTRPLTSSIFVFPLQLMQQSAAADNIITRYESIFRETF
ncbi:hypothetical protein [uncultured Hymenobacter sp.]|uniref:hypothetical protein n=1 Tax=uncultured Hymenobacter sp. TaxID=170016 RepID=UPI0035CB2955